MAKKSGDRLAQQTTQVEKAEASLKRAEGKVEQIQKRRDDLVGKLEQLDAQLTEAQQVVALEKQTVELQTQHRDNLKAFYERGGSDVAEGYVTPEEAAAETA